MAIETMDCPQGKVFFDPAYKGSEYGGVVINQDGKVTHFVAATPKDNAEKAKRNFPDPAVPLGNSMILCPVGNDPFFGGEEIHSLETFIRRWLQNALPAGNPLPIDDNDAIAHMVGKAMLDAGRTHRPNDAADDLDRLDALVRKGGQEGRTQVFGLFPQELLGALAKYHTQMQQGGARQRPGGQIGGAQI